MLAVRALMAHPLIGPYSLAKTWSKPISTMSSSPPGGNPLPMGFSACTALSGANYCYVDW